LDKRGRNTDSGEVENWNTTGYVFKTKHAIPREFLREVDGVL
jgi:hypothetical protein